jgi:alanine dehydrogenase
MPLLVTRREVEGLLDLTTAIDVTEAAFREQAAGAISTQPPRMLTTPRGALRMVSGALLQSRRMGLRAGPAMGYNAEGGERMVALLWDTETGDLLGVLSHPFGTLRTGATVGLATRWFAREDAHVLGMIGTGRNALSLLTAVCHVRPIEHIRVFSRDPEHRSRFAQRAGEALGRSVQVVDAAEKATLGADVVCVATNSLSPVLRAEQLSPGAFVATMGRPSELDGSVYLAAGLVVVGSKEHEQDYWDPSHTHQLMELVKAGKVQLAAIREMAEVAAGRAPRRTSAAQTIVFKESQGGFGDVAFASYVYDQARKRGLGQEVDL